MVGVNEGIRSATFTATSVATWYYSLWIGWGGSVGDNGTYHNGSCTWHDGNGLGYISSSFTAWKIASATSISEFSADKLISHPVSATRTVVSGPLKKRVMI